MTTAPVTPSGAPMAAGPGATVAPEAVVPLTAVHPVARVDLMPPEVHQARRFRRARRVMALAVCGVAALSMAAALAAWQDAVSARDDLVSEQARTDRLRADAAQYAEVPAVLGSIERARTSLQVAMAGEVGWYPVLDDISRTAPESVWFEQITLTALQPGVPVDNPLATPGAVATVEMTGRALDHQDVVAWLDRMDGLATWTDPVFGESATDGSGAADVPLTFTTSARLSAEAHTQRFDPSRLGGDTAEGGL